MLVLGSECLWLSSVTTCALWNCSIFAASGAYCLCYSCWIIIPSVFSNQTSVTRGIFTSPPSHLPFCKPIEQIWPVEDFTVCSWPCPVEERSVGVMYLICLLLGCLSQWILCIGVRIYLNIKHVPRQTYFILFLFLIFSLVNRLYRHVWWSPANSVRGWMCCLLHIFV